MFLIRAMDPRAQPQLPRSRAATGNTVGGEVSLRKTGLVLRKRKSIMEGYRDVSSRPPPWNKDKITLYSVTLCEVNWRHHNIALSKVNRDSSCPSPCASSHCELPQVFRSPLRCDFLWSASSSPKSLASASSVSCAVVLLHFIEIIYILVLVSLIRL